MKQISFEEKTILSTFAEFYGEEYAPDSEQNTILHVMAHKMFYLLNRDGIRLSNSDFVWNTHGPFSVALQKSLKQLDSKPHEIASFYQKSDAEDVLEENAILGISRLKDKLKLSEHQPDIVRWLELLASLVFINYSQKPLSSFQQINEQLKSRKPQYSSDEENRLAWMLLNEIHLVSEL